MNARRRTRGKGMISAPMSCVSRGIHAGGSISGTYDVHRFCPSPECAEQDLIGPRSRDVPAGTFGDVAEQAPAVVDGDDRGGAHRAASSRRPGRSLALPGFYLGEVVVLPPVDIDRVRKAELFVVLPAPERHLEDVVVAAPDVFSGDVLLWCHNVRSRYPNVRTLTNNQLVFVK